MKAGIALGGRSNTDSFIINNIIRGGESEGIYMSLSGEPWIIRNQIQINENGIVIRNSSPFIQNNIISYNNKTAVLSFELSAPKLENNLIFENDEIGIFLKDQSFGKI